MTSAHETTSNLHAPPTNGVVETTLVNGDFSLYVKEVSEILHSITESGVISASDAYIVVLDLLDDNKTMGWLMTVVGTGKVDDVFRAACKHNCVKAIDILLGRVSRDAMEMGIFEAIRRHNIDVVRVVGPKLSGDDEVVKKMVMKCFDYGGDFKTLECLVTSMSPSEEVIAHCVAAATGLGLSDSARFMTKWRDFAHPKAS